MKLAWPPTALQKLLAIILAVLLLWAGGCIYIVQREKALRRSEGQTNIQLKGE